MHKRISERFAFIVAILTIVLGLYLVSFHSYILFHSLIEITTISICFTLFILTLNARAYLSNNYLKLIGIGYAFIALIDLIHTLAYKGMNVFPDYGANLPTQLWIAARYLQAVTLCAAPIFMERSLNDRAVIGGYAITVAVLLTIVFTGGFPDCYIEGKGLTPFKIISEYMITAILFAASYFLYLKRNHFNRTVFHFTICSIACVAVSEISFTTYLSVYGFANLIGHFFKLAAFYLIYRALLVTGFKEPFDLIFRELKQAEEALRKAHDNLEKQVSERTVDLEIANKELQTEITERRQAEEALKKSSMEIHDLYNRAPCGYHSLDEDGLFVQINDTELQWLGYSRDEIVGKKTFPDLITERSRKTFQDIFSEFKARGWVRDLEFEMVREDGSILPVLLSATAVIDENGNYVMSRSTVYDISARIQAEKNLHRLNRELRAISDCNQTMLRAVDEQTLLNDICRIICDVAGYRMAWVGYAEHDDAKTIRPVAWAGVVDGYLSIVNITWADTERGHGPTGTAIRNGKSSCVQDFAIESRLSLWREHALQRGYRSSISLPLKNGNAATFGALNIYSTEPNTFTPDEVRLLEELTEDLAFGIDTLHTRAERKQMEEEQERLQAQFLQAQKMESVGRLAGGVAHDFNNMLGVILGHTEVALAQLHPTQPLFVNMEGILKATERSIDLTRQLLAFARKQTIAPQVLDLNDTVEGMLKILRRLIGEDIDLTWQPGAGGWLVKVDPSQIDQILANLCVNARDAISGVGKVTIETHTVIFDETDCAGDPGFFPGEYVLLAVSDNGCGMDKVTMDNLFEPFFTTKEKGKGTGLGLATVYGIVKQNDGFINVYSEPDKGTTFKIYLPRHAGQYEQIKEKKPAVSAARGDETILLVEDEPDMLRMITMILERLGYNVLAAKTPGEAIRLAEEHAGRIHLLMTDVVMPEMNGRDLTIKMLSRYPDLKGLFMSGYTADVIAHHGMLEEGVHFIQKPFSIKDLATKVREVLGSR